MGTTVEIPPPATVFKGLSLAALRGLGVTLRAQFGERWNTMTTEEVVKEFVVPRTEARQCRLVDLPEYVAAEAVGRPSYFISHAWKGTFATLFNRVLEFLVSASDETGVWVDVFAVNQHREALHQQNRQDVMAFEDVVEHCVGTIVVVDMARMNPATRAWCVYEWDATIWHHGSDGLQMLMSEEDRVQIVGSIDIEEAQCFHLVDKAMILQRVREHHGDAATFNHMLQTSLLLAPLSYRADQQRHRQRSAGTTWEWGAVEAWLDGPHRALCVLAGAGTGKSTICTMLMDHLAAERPRLVVAAHFLKYSDQRRLDPVLAIRSLAHQLASRSAAFRERLFALDPAHVTALVDPESAFRDLLQAPLSQVREPVLILLDALDEADPPEQYLPGFRGNVKACGNKTLQLLTRQLVQLGANVRFVITTRPDAVCSQIEPLLGRIFADSVTLLRPEALRSEAAAEPGAQGTGVLVYHTVAKECAALGDSWGKDHADLSDVYSAYRRVFASALAELSAEDRDGVLALLEALLAAQEPLAESSLQRMGLAGAMPRLPGWGCLFYVVEHHVYLLHKSLSDWLLQESQAEVAAVRGLEVARGHERLGAFLSRHRASPSAYCLKYLLFHLASSRLDGARRQLDEALLDWSFLVRVVQSRNAGRAAQALGSIPQSAHSEVSYDILRWLRLAMHELEENPCLEHFAATAWMTAPLGSVPHMKAAEHAARRGWECSEKSGQQGGRGKASKGNLSLGKRDREKDSTEHDEASEERLPGEAERRVQEELNFRGKSMWDLGISAQAVKQLRLHLESFFAHRGRPLAAVTIEDVAVEFVLERTKSSRCRFVELAQYVDGSEVGTPTHFVRPMTWNSPFVTVLEKIQRTLEDAEEVEAYVWLDFLAVNHHTTTQQHEVVDYAGLSEYDSKAKMGTTVEIPPPATVFKGLSLAALRGLGVTLRAQFGERWNTMTTEEVVKEFVVPRTEARQCRLVDLPEYVAAEAVGRPSYFISHAWKGTFATLFNRVLEFLVSASDETRVWVDVFAVNQHREALHQQNRQDVMAFEDVVEHCVGTIVVVDMARMNPATRAWCVYEWDATIWHHGSDGLQMLMSEEDRVQIVGSIDIEEAQCFHLVDKAMILQRVREHHGDAATFNHMLQTSLLLAPLSYRADQRRHRQRSAGTAWEWGAVEAWLDGPHRALCVLDGAGTGKSTICTMLMDHLAAERPRLVVAAHFLKYSDQRRLDPVLAIRSLAHQLASRSAAFRERLFALDPAHVTALVDPESAFRDLLQAPLSQVREPVLILLDALDEADPPEQYLPGFRGNVKACGNKTLQLLTRQLVQLGANVRFVITTRPDAVCSQIEPLLGRIFADSVTLLRPEALRSEAAAEPGAQGTGVLVYHTVAKECAALGDSWGKDHADLSDVYSAYRRVFASALAELNAEDRDGVLGLLEALLAAQEPLAESSLQRMGLAGAMPRLPGWGCLFYVAEHHVYLLHKSLSDWLLQESQAEGAAVRGLEVARGHERLGAFLSRHRASPSAYCLKYLLFHLASSRLPDGACRQLDEALLDWSFLVRVVRSKNAGRAAQALGSIPQSAHSEVSYDMLRWLRLAMHKLERNPCLEHFAAMAWGTAPLGSVPHMKAAEHTARRGWESGHGQQ
ncbi:hypothetical protein CYMTET_17495 [Cymbomonas tetramitiformis]|uniref:NACHT domain-containing protein n=1 Tax=Cymbomonas tetramitiformis TaxID=36881 RepID=A0AAE0GAF8_9CHLO|nr:hypothetical protein CYMTET_17495 [Cymbomonas tetramitiformis]